MPTVSADWFLLGAAFGAIGAWMMVIRPARNLRRMRREQDHAKRHGG